MRFLASALMAVVLTAVCWSEEAVQPAPVPLCSIAARNCHAPKKDLKKAAQAFERGLKLNQDKRPAEAYEEFAEAARLVSGNIDYLTAREIARQQVVFDHIQKGNDLLLAKRRVEALAEFRAALQLDPGNEFARQRLRDALGEDLPRVSPTLRLVAQSDPVDLKPLSGQRDFLYRGDSRGLIETVARSFGLAARFDDSFVSRPVRFEVRGVDFYKAIGLAAMVAKSFWSPLSENEFLVAADTLENHRQFDRLSVRTFYVSGVSTPQELNDLVNLLRGVFDIRFITPSPSRSTITVRAPRETLEAASLFLEDLAAGPPQVMLDIQAFEVSHSMLRTLGVKLPLQYQVFSLSSIAGLLASTPNLQDLINQLISSGGINQANATAIQALLAQLQNQLNPLLTTPFATFGGGLTLMALTIPPASITAQLNESTVRNLEHVTMRAMQGRPSTFRVGSRFPILNATFAPIFNSPALSQVIQNKSFQPAFPSFNYEDLGVTVKATPQVHGDSEVTLDLETQVKAITGQSFNGVPVLSNREYKGMITLKDGETAVVVSSVSRSEQKSLQGLPGIGRVPGFGLLFSTENVDNEEDEILVVITPHLLNSGARPGGATWLPPIK